MMRKLGINEAGKNQQFEVIDLFSGCGGLSFGFHELEKTIGAFKIAAAIDIDDHANATYEDNYGFSPKALDMQSLSAREIVKKLTLGESEGRIVVGGPPCVAFSSHKKKDKRTDARSSLVVRFAKIAVALKPSLILMENVPDLLGTRHWNHFNRFRQVLERAGYTLRLCIANMAEFGVPQARHRLICIAVRKGMPSLPTGHRSDYDFSTVRDAIGNLRPLEAGESCPDDPMHITSRHRQSTVDLIRQIPRDGGSRPKGLGPKCLDKVKGFSDVYGRLHWDRPSVTLTARCRTPSCGRYVHPEQHRGLSVREAALLQSFPPSFYFSGPFDDKFKQIGNSVAPLFSLALAVHTAGILTGKVRSDSRTSQLPPDKPTFRSFSGFIANR